MWTERRKGYFVNRERGIMANMFQQGKDIGMFINDVCHYGFKSHDEAEEYLMKFYQHGDLVFDSTRNGGIMATNKNTNNQYIIFNKAYKTHLLAIIDSERSYYEVESVRRGRLLANDLERIEHVAD